MSEAVVSETPFVQIDLDAFNAGAGSQTGVKIEEQAFLGHINLRGSPDDGAFLDVVAKVLGFSLPLQANTMEEGDGIRAFWLGPDEWLLVTPADHQDKLSETLRGALVDQFVAITDISSGQTQLTISGESARRLLSKGCPLDLHPRVFKQGDCAQTHIAKSSALIYLVDEAPVFEVIVRRSFSDYLGLWLTDAAMEFATES